MPDLSPPSWAPVTPEEVVARALAQRGRGVYKLGGGALFTAPDVYSSEGNRFPGFADCTGLCAYAAKYRRGQWNTDAIVDDARGAHARFYVVGDDVRPSDFIVTGRGHGLPDHAGIIVEVRPGFVRGGANWWTFLRVAHCSGAGQFTDDPTTPVADVYGAVRVDDARRWRRTGYIIRPKHVTGGNGPGGRGGIKTLLAAGVVLAGFKLLA